MEPLTSTLISVYNVDTSVLTSEIKIILDLKKTVIAKVLAISIPSDVFHYINRGCGLW